MKKWRVLFTLLVLRSPQMNILGETQTSPLFILVLPLVLTCQWILLDLQVISPPPLLPPPRIVQLENHTNGRSDHNDICERCDSGGDLLCCDFCNLVSFCSSCLTFRSYVLLGGGGQHYGRVVCTS